MIKSKKDHLIRKAAESGIFKVTTEGIILRRFGGYRGIGETWEPVEFIFSRTKYKYVNYGNTKILSHRLAYFLYTSCLDDTLVINHKNGIRSDNREDNLELITASENSGHALQSGLRTAVGPKNDKCALTKHSKETVEKVRELGLTDISFRAIGRIVGMSHGNVSSIVNRRTRLY